MQQNPDNPNQAFGQSFSPPQNPQQPYPPNQARPGVSSLEEASHYPNGRKSLDSSDVDTVSPEGQQQLFEQIYAKYRAQSLAAASRPQANVNAEYSEPPRLNRFERHCEFHQQLSPCGCRKGSQPADATGETSKNNRVVVGQQKEEEAQVEKKTNGSAKEQVNEERDNGGTEEADEDVGSSVRCRCCPVCKSQKKTEKWVLVQCPRGDTNEDENEIDVDAEDGVGERMQDDGQSKLPQQSALDPDQETTEENVQDVENNEEMETGEPIDFDEHSAMETNQDTGKSMDREEHPTTETSQEAEQLGFHQERAIDPGQETLERDASTFTPTIENTAENQEEPGSENNPEPDQDETQGNPTHDYTPSTFNEPFVMPSGSGPEQMKRFFKWVRKLNTMPVPPATDYNPSPPSCEERTPLKQYMRFFIPIMDRAFIEPFPPEYWRPPLALYREIAGPATPREMFQTEAPRFLLRYRYYIQMTIKTYVRLAQQHDRGRLFPQDDVDWALKNRTEANVQGNQGGMEESITELENWRLQLKETRSKILVDCVTQLTSEYVWHLISETRLNKAFQAIAQRGNVEYLRWVPFIENYGQSSIEELYSLYCGIKYALQPRDPADINFRNKMIDLIVEDFKDLETGGNQELVDVTRLWRARRILEHQRPFWLRDRMDGTFSKGNNMHERVPLFPHNVKPRLHEDGDLEQQGVDYLSLLAADYGHSLTRWAFSVALFIQWWRRKQDKEPIWNGPPDNQPWYETLAYQVLDFAAPKDFVIRFERDGSFERVSLKTMSKKVGKSLKISRAYIFQQIKKRRIWERPYNKSQRDERYFSKDKKNNTPLKRSKVFNLSDSMMAENLDNTIDLDQDQFFFLNRAVERRKNLWKLALRSHSLELQHALNRSDAWGGPHFDKITPNVALEHNPKTIIAPYFYKNDPLLRFISSYLINILSRNDPLWPNAKNEMAEGITTTRSHHAQECFQPSRIAAMLSFLMKDAKFEPGRNGAPLVVFMMGTDTTSLSHKNKETEGNDTQGLSKTATESFCKIRMQFPEDTNKRKSFTENLIKWIDTIPYPDTTLDPTSTFEALDLGKLCISDSDLERGLNETMIKTEEGNSQNVSSTGL